MSVHAEENKIIFLKHLRPGGYAEYPLLLNYTPINVYFTGNIAEWLKYNFSNNILFIIASPPKNINQGRHSGFLVIEKEPSNQITSVATSTQIYPVIIEITKNIFSHVVIEDISVTSSQNKTAKLNILARNIGNVNNNLFIEIKINETNATYFKHFSIPSLSQRTFSFEIGDCINCTLLISAKSNEGLIRKDVILVNQESLHALSAQEQPTPLSMNLTSILFLIVLIILIILRISLEKTKKRKKVYPKTLNKRKTKR